MKIGIPSTEPDPDGMVETKLGTAAHILVVETDDMSYAVLKGLSHISGPAAGAQAVSKILDMGAQVILVGHISPFISEVLAKQKIEVVTQVTGSVRKAVADYVHSKSIDNDMEKENPSGENSTPQNQWLSALGKGFRQIHSFLPMLIGVVLLLGLFQGFVSQQDLLSLFGGSAFQDSLWGACIGSLLAGNPVNSYVIGKELMTSGVGTAGAAALMLAWVNVGLIQLPMEARALGMRFALIRNITGFMMAVVLSFAMARLIGDAI